MSTPLACINVGTGLPLVLLHAFPLAKEMWQPQVSALSARYRLIAPDLRGFGSSPPWSGEPGIEAMANDVASLLDALQVQEPCVLGGLSMGGYVALAFARQHPGRLRGLILADTRAEADTDEGKTNRNSTMAFLEQHPVQDLIEQMMPKLLAERTAREQPSIVEEVRRMASAQSPVGVRSAVQALRDRPDSTPHLARIKVPCLILVGSEDALTPPALSEKMRDGIPNAKMVALSGAGHLANLEQPEAFNKAVVDFLHTI